MDLKKILREETSLKPGQEVDLLIGESSPLGMKVLINDQYEGLLYHTEIFKPLSKGDHVKGYIKKLREDNKIDVSLEPFGYRKVEPNMDKILKKLKEQNGLLHLTDKSDPQKIYDQLQMSKKVFKKAIGGLYKQKLIRIESDGVYLNIQVS